MYNADREPWDARLVEWMSRGSGTARGGGKTKPRDRALLGAFWIIYLTVHTAIDHGRWVYVVGYCLFVVLVLLVTGARERTPHH
jgi:hypothetical protein